jgi:hypothetical protein
MNQFVISPTRFRRAFERFQAIHVEKCGWPLDRFNNRQSFVFKEEGYKADVRAVAVATLGAKRWTRSMIGSGEILDRVITAIELPGNNLLQWQARNGPQSRAHRRLIEARKQKEDRRELEALFFDLYRTKREARYQSVFEALIVICGRRYELLGYLFFVADPVRFLPIRTTTFDKALKELGVDLKTQGQCGWENYQEFVAAMRAVQDRLRAEGITDAMLLDAHSFCWILARLGDEGAALREPTPARMVTFSGNIQDAPEAVARSPKDDAAVRDIKLEAERRHASGEIAEEIALKAEQKRLRDAGRDDLADGVESVANKPGLGYDIKSFETDGSERFIEVKNVSKGKRFFLSEGEWQTSQARSNYWFYLVSGVDNQRPVVTVLPASGLEPQHLQPVQYVVGFRG